MLWIACGLKNWEEEYMVPKEVSQHQLKNIMKGAAEVGIEYGSLVW